MFLGGDVHQGYLHQAEFPPSTGVQSAVYQAVCSPFRNPLNRRERIPLQALRRSRLLGSAIRRLAHAAGIRDPEASWRLAQEPTFDNQMATLHLDGRNATLRIERTRPGDGQNPTLDTTLVEQLA